MRLLDQEMVQDPARIVSALFVSPFEDDHEYMKRFFMRTKWKLYSAQTYQRAALWLQSEPISVIVTEKELPDGSWLDLLREAHGCSTSPVLVATYRFSEVETLDQLLARGAYDVLAKPFSEVEVSQIISFAWQRWRSKRMAAARQERVVRMACA